MTRPTQRRIKKHNAYFCEWVVYDNLNEDERQMEENSQQTFVINDLWTPELRKDFKYTK